MKAHDPLADTLSPYWREKVERAFREVPPPPLRAREDRRFGTDHHSTNQPTSGDHSE